MNSISSKIVVWGLMMAALGIAAGFLPWYQLMVFGKSATIPGINLWQGKVVVCLFVVIGVRTINIWGVPRSQAAWLIAVGTAVAGVAGQYIIQVMLPAPTRIEVHQGGAVANDIAEDLIMRMSGHLSLGAPLALLMGLGLVVLGIWELRNKTAAQSML